VAQCTDFVKNFVRDKLNDVDAAEADAVAEHVANCVASNNRWQLIGPFPGGQDFRGLDTVYEPEQAATQQPEYRVGDRTLAWKQVDVRPGGYVDLRKEVSVSEPIVAYASATFECPHEQEAVLRIGGDDGCRLWLNGEQIYQVRAVRGCREGTDQVKVKLKEGANHMLFKIEQVAGDWGFSFDVIDEQGWPIQLDRQAEM